MGNRIYLVILGEKFKYRTGWRRSGEQRGSKSEWEEVTATEPQLAAPGLSIVSLSGLSGFWSCHCPAASVRRLTVR